LNTLLVVDPLCNDLDKLPDVTFIINGAFPLVLKPRDYVVEVFDVAGCGALSSVSNFPDSNSQVAQTVQNTMDGTTLCSSGFTPIDMYVCSYADGLDSDCSQPHHLLSNQDPVEQTIRNVASGLGGWSEGFTVCASTHLKTYWTFNSLDA